jgi:hypothetical protein
VAEGALHEGVFLEEKEVGHEFQVAVGTREGLVGFDADGEDHGYDDADEDDEGNDEGRHGFTVKDIASTLKFPFSRIEKFIVLS